MYAKRPHSKCQANQANANEAVGPVTGRPWQCEGFFVVFSFDILSSITVLVNSS